MEIQQHDGVVVEAAGFQQGFAKCYWRRKRCHIELIMMMS